MIRMANKETNVVSTYLLLLTKHSTNAVVFIYISFKLVEQSLIVRLGFLSLVDVISPTMKPNSFLGSNLHFFLHPQSICHSFQNSKDISWNHRHSDAPLEIIWLHTFIPYRCNNEVLVPGKAVSASHRSSSSNWNYIVSPLLTQHSAE